MKMTRRAAWVGAAMLAAAIGTTAHAGTESTAPKLSFALVGDMPYAADQVPQFDALVDHVNADPTVRFMIHVGDVKGGGERCDDTLLQQRFAQIARVKVPVVYTPGDNEWTDCHRTAAGAFLPTERLAFLRKLAYPVPGQTLGQTPARVQTQAADPAFATYVENTMFVRSDVVFAAVHVVGSSNNLAPWSGIDPADTSTTPRPDRIAEYEGRRAAALAWIDRAFDEADRRAAVGVVLAWQANPGIDTLPGDPLRNGFEELLAEVKTRALAFGKPVLLVQGDNHELILDQPLARDAEPTPKVPKFQRLQGIGAPRIHWVKVQIDPRSPSVFAVQPQWVPGNP